MISVFGASGFIGSKWMELYSDASFAEERSSISSKYKDILYFRGTNSNYSVFKDPTLEVKTNLLLLTEMFKNLTPEHSFNLISSWFVYGKNNCEINKESDCCNPKGFYSIAKLSQEQLLESYCETFNIKYKILRLCNIIGKDKNATSQKNATEYMISKLRNNEEVNVYEGDNYRNFLNVEDACRAIKLITDNGQETIYNIGSKESTRMIDIIDYCKNKLNSKSKINVIESPKFHQQVQAKNFHMNIDKLESLGFKPKYSLEDTLNILCK